VLIAGAILAFLFILRISGILTPVLWGIVVAYAFNPLVRVLNRRTGLPRVAIVGGLYLLALGALIALLSVTIPALNDQLTQLSRDLLPMVQNLETLYFGPHNAPLNIAGFSIDVAQVTRQVVNSFNSALNDFAGGTVKVATTTIERITQLFLFLVVTFYLLLDAPRIGAYFARSIPQRHRDEVLTVARDVDACLTQYLRAEALLILIMGSASFIVLSFFGVRFAIILAPIVGVLEIFPIIGPFTAIALVTLVAIFSPPNFGLAHTASALLVALVFFIMRQIEDYAVIPNVVGHAVRLHPALILFAVAVGASLGGALGLFVAVPVTGALKVLGAYLYQKLDLE
jgi:predicted PurR-regulated permease PerM